MTLLAIYLSMLVGSACTVIAWTAMRRREKHNIGKLGWLFLVLLTPPIGLLLFLLFGGKRISAEHSERKQLILPEGPEDANLDGPHSAIAKARRLPPPSACNCFEWFRSPPRMKAELIDLVRSARTRVFLHSFIMADDELAQELIEILAEKARSGVEVRLMIDGFGSFLFPDSLLHELESAGGKTTRFKPLSRLSRFAYSNFRNHRKLVCVDGCRAIIGGSNLVAYEVTDEPDEDTWIDYFARVEGIAARQLEAVFVSDWNFNTDESLEVTPDCDASPECEFHNGGTPLQVIPVGPDGPDEILDDVWLTAINRADSRVWIMTPYFIPPPIAMGALTMAARRGVDVRVMFPAESDVTPADSARHDYADEIVESGGTILRYPNRMVHAKMLLVDTDVAFIGSANFDMRSFFLNYELTMGVFGEDKISEMADWYCELSENCIEGPREATWQRRSLRVLTRIFAEEL